MKPGAACVTASNAAACAEAFAAVARGLELSEACYIGSPAAPCQYYLATTAGDQVRRFLPGSGYLDFLRFPWSLYHRPIVRELQAALRAAAGADVLNIGSGPFWELSELDCGGNAQGFSRRGLHPTKLDRESLARLLDDAGTPAHTIRRIAFGWVLVALAQRSIQDAASANQRAHPDFSVQDSSGEPVAGAWPVVPSALPVSVQCAARWVEDETQLRDEPSD
ncbi:MAG TPA: hypothetical protein VK524_30850 [Polyangiaceae bacterium]|nr:hypothetical protein [Polyangiaceae bacterium]